MSRNLAPCSGCGTETGAHEFGCKEFRRVEAEHETATLIDGLEDAVRSRVHNEIPLADYERAREALEQSIRQR